MAGWATVTMVPSSETIMAPTDRVSRVSQGWPRTPRRGGEGGPPCPSAAAVCPVALLM